MSFAPQCVFGQCCHGLSERQSNCLDAASEGSNTTTGSALVIPVGGNHSEARKAAREARHLREKALRAHAQAAARIEEANNAGRGHDVWTLDLHGLHGSEAIEAVDRR